MTRYLGELICREFARCHMITVTSLRLGKLVLEEETGGHPADPMWLDFRDAAQCVPVCLESGPQRGCMVGQTLGGVSYLRAKYPTRNT